ncbi:MAG: uracil-DNA glycosylase family protein [Pirellula sp.]|jgi:uracil-DNA glycosylase family 4
MENNEWYLATKQLLTHLQRSGITRLPIAHQPLPDAIIAWGQQESSGLASHPAITDPIAGQTRSTLVGQLATTISNPQPKSALPSGSSSPARPVDNTSQPAAVPGMQRPSALPTFAQAPVTGEAKAWASPKGTSGERIESLRILSEEVKACRKCSDIVCRRQQTVFGIGPHDVRFVMFGEAPGAEEDRTGEPFVGPAGQLLDKILVATGLKRDEVYIMNTLKCRPPNNRTPTEIEVENCRPFFESQIEILQPEYIICWGSVASRALLKTTESIGRLRGRFYRYKQAKVLVTYHPSYLLRNPDAKRQTWEDMKFLMRDMGTLK